MRATDRCPLAGIEPSARSDSCATAAPASRIWPGPPRRVPRARRPVDECRVDPCRSCFAAFGAGAFSGVFGFAVFVGSGSGVLAGSGFGVLAGLVGWTLAGRHAGVLCESGFPCRAHVGVAGFAVAGGVGRGRAGGPVAGGPVAGGVAGSAFSGSSGVALSSAITATAATAGSESSDGVGVGVGEGSGSARVRVSATARD